MKINSFLVFFLLLGFKSNAQKIYAVDHASQADVKVFVADYQSLGFSLREHPLSLLRTELNKRKILTAQRIKTLRNRKSARIAGIVTSRQRPSTSSGVVFVTLEDETGYTNVVIWHRIASEQRQVLLNAKLLGVTGHIERDGQVIHLIAKKLVDYSPLLGKLVTTSRNFH